MKQQNIVFVCVVVLIMPILMASCSARDPLVDQLIDLEETEFPGQEISDRRIQELEQEIKKYREAVDAQVHANGQLMVYYRMLGLRFLERQMYGPAMEALENALAITPANANLHSYYATAAAYSAKARYESAEQDRLLQRAEQAYNRALELAPNHSNALYGLSVLLVFELHRPGDALVYLDRVLELQRNHFEARFVRAYAHAALGNIAEAVHDYDAIIETARNAEMRREATRLRSEVQGEIR